MDSPIIQSFPLGMPWRTVDPFLFCVHHLDHYPAGDGSLAPAASLAGRDIGQDFAGIDGWRMYHGDTVPGFPQHPHRGFETITYVRRGFVDHSDSLGAIARYGSGDVQWLTAGRGIVHAEMFPLVETEDDNPTELFQIWLNLPAEDKFADPHFEMLWAEDIPVVETGDGVTVTVVAGAMGDAVPPSPPPHSWAARPDSDVAVWHIELTDGSSWSIPPASQGTIRSIYVVDGNGITLDDAPLAAGTGAVVESDRPVRLATLDGPTAALVLQGRPIAEPVAQYGPFVMNTEQQIHEAFADYRSTGFGGWPWPDDDPTNGNGPERFAQTPAGSRTTPPR